MYVVFVNANSVPISKNKSPENIANAITSLATVIMVFYALDQNMVFVSAVSATVCRAGPALLAIVETPMLHVSLQDRQAKKCALDTEFVNAEFASVMLLRMADIQEGKLGLQYW